MGLLHGDVHFEAAELRFEPGDVFVFYTDGITDAADAAGLDFGQDRIVEAARGASERSAAAVVAAVHAAADAFRGDAARSDDATVIAVRVPARRLTRDPLQIYSQSIRNQTVEAQSSCSP